MAFVDVSEDVNARVGEFLAPGVTRFFEWLAYVLRPHPPMTIRTLEGDILSGVAIVHRGEVTAFIGTRDRSRLPADRPGAPLWGSP